MAATGWNVQRCQPNSFGWVSACRCFVRSESELKAFRTYFLRLLADARAASSAHRAAAAISCSLCQEARPGRQLLRPSCVVAGWSMDFTSWKEKQKFPPTLLANFRLAVQSWAYFQRNPGSDEKRPSEEVQHRPSWCKHCT